MAAVVEEFSRFYANAGGKKAASAAKEAEAFYNDNIQPVCSLVETNAAKALVLQGR